MAAGLDQLRSHTAQILQRESLMVVRFDVETFEPEYRASALAEVLTVLPIPLDITTTGEIGDLGFDAISNNFGSTYLVSCIGRGAIVHRDSKRVDQDHEPTLILSLVTAGHSTLRQGDTQTSVGTGDIALYTSTMPYVQTLDRVARHTFMFEYRALGLSDKVIEGHAGRIIDLSTPLGRVVTNYLRDMGTHGLHLPDDERAAMERPTLDLVRALLATEAGHTDTATDAIGATMDIQIVDYLNHHLRDRDLTIAKVARAHNISERYTYLLLARQGITFGEWIRNHRLAGAAQSLRDHPDTSIGRIADLWAFPDQANFTRAFRRAYGVSPREYRHHHAGDGAPPCP